MYLEYLQAFITVLLLCNNGCLTTGIIHPNCTKEDIRTLRCNYVPKDIDNGISRVRVLKFTNEKTEMITQANFSSPNWRNVEYLEFGEQNKRLLAHLDFKKDCFVTLTNLQELRLHINWLILSPDVFLGLDSVKTLDLSGCPRMTFDQVKQALNGSHKLPGLRKLILSKWNTVRGPYAFNDSFVEVLLPRNITYIDLSSSQITVINLTSIAKKLKHLEGMNMSYSTIGDIFDKHLEQSDIQHVKSVDLSQATLPMHSMSLPPGKFVLANTHASSSHIHPSIYLFFTPRTMNLSGVVHKYTTLWLKNCTATIDKDLKWHTKELVLQQNNFRRLDINVNCSEYNVSSLRLIDFSKNGMEYLHPSFLHCMPNLEIVDLSKNNLYLMVEENFILFERMFHKLPYIKHISIAANSLHTIPQQLFINSKMVEIIDLSSNNLQQVTFILHDLENLRTLDLRSNNIQNLDSMSISHLSSIRTDKNYSSKIVLTSNPISCSECTTKPFLKWLLSTNLTDVRSQKLTCINEDNHQELINESTLHLVQKICTRKTILLAGSVSGAVVFVFILTLLSVIFIRRRRAQKIQNRVNVINRLREGEGQHEFVAYLAYSSDDQDFISKYVLYQLCENLKLMTGIDRELISTGDKHLRFGFDIHSETIRCIERSSVVIVVVSRNFCTSEYCRNELDEAYIRRKPIVLMFKERVEEDAMMPTMKELYRKNVRMLWTFENGEYILKSTWDNVCTSVLDLVQCDI